MVKHYIYDVDKETVLDKISQLQPLNYNQFRWWRRFDTPNKPLHKYSDLLRKIRNGDYDFSHYYWQARYAEMEINELHHETYPDAVLFNEKNAMNGEENVYGMILRKTKKNVWLILQKIFTIHSKCLESR